MKEILTIDVELRKDNQDDVAKIVVKNLRPDWDPDAIVCQAITGGFINITVIVSRDGSDMSDALVLRTVSEEYGGPVTQQHNVLRFIHHQCLGPVMLAFITNGVCMQFVRGRVFEWSEWKKLTEPAVWKPLARSFATWHQTSVYEAAREAHIVQQKDLLFGPVVKNFWDKILAMPGMDEHRACLPASRELLAEENDVMRKLTDQGDVDEAFCHLDVHVTNFVCDEAAGEVTLLDFDYSGISYQQFDLAWFFHLFQGIEDASLDNYPSEHYRRAFLVEYLTHRKLLDGKPDVTSDEVEKLLIQVEKMRLMQYMRSVVNGPCMWHNTGYTGYMEVSKDAWKRYREVKETVLAMKSC